MTPPCNIKTGRCAPGTSLDFKEIDCGIAIVDIRLYFPTNDENVLVCEVNETGLAPVDRRRIRELNFWLSGGHHVKVIIANKCGQLRVKVLETVDVILNLHCEIAIEIKTIIGLQRKCARFSIKSKKRLAEVRTMMPAKVCR